LAHVLLRTAIVGERFVAGSHTRKAGDWEEGDPFVPALLKSVQSWYPPRRKQCPACGSWWGSSSRLLPSSHGRYQGTAVNRLSAALLPSEPDGAVPPAEMHKTAIPQALFQMHRSNKQRWLEL